MDDEETWPSAEQNARRGRTFKDARALEEALATGDRGQLVAALTACSELQPLADHRVNWLNAGAFDCDPEGLALWLQQRADLVGAKVAIENLAQAVLQRKWEIARCIVVFGVGVEGTVDLGEGISLEPFAARPRTRIASHDDSLRHPIETVLIMRGQERGRLEGTDPGYSPDEIAAWLEERQRSLDVVLGIISLATRAAVVDVIEWAESATLPRFPRESGSSMKPLAFTPSHVILTEQQAELARRMLTAFTALKHRQDVVRLALSRYRRAIISYRRDSQATALELATAFEALLIPEQVESITLSLCLRAAWLLGRTSAERREIFKLVQQLYALRSDIVHTGGKNWGREKKEKEWKYQVVQRHEQLLLEAMEQFARLAEHLVLDGFPQSWSDLVLGVGRDELGAPGMRDMTAEPDQP